MSPEPPLSQQPLIAPRPVPPGFALRRFVRRNLLATLTTVVFLAVAVLVLVQIDRVYYNQAKSDAITPWIEDGRYLGGATREELARTALEYVEPRDRTALWTPETDARIRSLLGVQSERLLRENPMLLSVTVMDTQRNVIVEAKWPQRMAEMNGFDNCLFVRRWEKLLTNRQELKPLDRRRYIALRYTTPKDNPDVEAVTREWRVYAGLILLGIAVPYGLLMWGVVLPTRNVLSALDKGSAVGSPFLDRPRTLLEIYYNNLARDATISVFSTHLRARAADEGLVDDDNLPALATRLLRELFPIGVAGVVSLHRADKDAAWAFDEGRSALDGFDQQTAARLRQVGYVERALKGEDSATFVAECVQESDVQRAVLVVPLAGRLAANPAWWRDVVKASADEVRFAARIAEQRRRVIMQEKSKANISLSRNLGHDLTNIIATMKLDLMTVKPMLEMPGEKVHESPQKQRIFREALESLLSSTRFLQETVNLYRSFTYLSRPKFEEISLGALVDEAARLFRLSSSRSIAVRVEADGSLPPIVVEPRLLKLALFNLMSNASDAIKLSATAERTTGEIVLRTGRGRTDDAQVVAVEDTGGGIRDRDGRLLEPEEIDRVFQLGYTTKEQGTGEGLGLSWVSQIVREFHDGELQARNRPEGGASFSIVLFAAVTKDLAEGSRDGEPTAADKTGEN